jgi:drug/metabolite transporter (DMT)-like permease
MIPATGLGLLLAAALAAPFATFAAVSDLQLLWIVLAGAVVVPGSLMLLTLGPRYLAAPEVAMLALLETVIGPFWVWMVLSEEPPNRSILGGTLIVVTLLVHGALRLRRRPIAGPILNVPEPAPDGARSHRPGGP